MLVDEGESAKSKCERECVFNIPSVGSILFVLRWY